MFEIAARRFWPLAILAVVLTAAVITADRLYGVSGLLAGREARSAAKFLGSLSLAGLAAALAYYAAREIVSRLRKTAAPPPAVGGILQALLSAARGIHPLAGVLALCAATLHGYLFLFAGAPARNGFSLTSGELAFDALGIIALTGIQLRRRPAAQMVRKSHRIAAGVLVVVALIHKAFAG